LRVGASASFTAAPVRTEGWLASPAWDRDACAAIVRALFTAACMAILLAVVNDDPTFLAFVGETLSAEGYDPHLFRVDVTNVRHILAAAPRVDCDANADLRPPVCREPLLRFGAQIADDFDAHHDVFNLLPRAGDLSADNREPNEKWVHLPDGPEMLDRGWGPIDCRPVRRVVGHYKTEEWSGKGPRGTSEPWGRFPWSVP